LKLLRRCLHEAWSLFIDDGALAAYVVGWIAVACLALRQAPAGPWSGPILFAGLSVIFIVSARRRP